MKKIFWRILLTGACIASQSSLAYNLQTDPFNVLNNSPESPAKNMINKRCDFPALPPSPLTLADAVERALCFNPQTKLAWINVKMQAATFGIGLAAYLPTVNARGSVNITERSSTYTSNAAYNTDVNGIELNGSLNLNWVLYDFGLRAANLESARQILNAANASQDDVIQTTFLNTAQAFYETQSTSALLSANLEAEHAAEKSLNAAEAKYLAGIGSLADKLQAQTAHAQAISTMVQAEGDLRSAMGNLNILMGLNASVTLKLTEINDSAIDEPLFEKAVDRLIEQTEHDHPKILSAQAQLKAAKARIDLVRAEGLPRLSLTASSDYFKTNATPINNQGSSEQTVNSGRVGIQLDIPLFEGFGRHYKILEAESQAQTKEAELENIQQQVALAVWKSYQALGTGLENLKAIKSLIQSAQQSFDVAVGRYKAGVGNIIELLKAQTDLANARQQKLLSMTRWQAARVKLAASIGNLSMETIH
ncbi:MAG: TolC family protein [Methylococcales bacterium]